MGHPNYTVKNFNMVLIEHESSKVLWCANILVFRKQAVPLTHLAEESGTKTKGQTHKLTHRKSLSLKKKIMKIDTNMLLPAL